MRIPASFSAQQHWYGASYPQALLTLRKVVQAALGILVILTLVYKRQRELQKRPWRIWLFDVSKQIVGQMFIHGTNVFLSDVVSHLMFANACVFYFLHILLDTTLGVGALYLILHGLTRLFTETLKFKGLESGVYGTPPSISFWFRQAALYVLSLTTMKLLVIMILVLFPGIFRLGEWLLSWTRVGGSDSLQVIFAMGIFPISMNVLQFWLIDSIVKASGSPIDTSSHDRLPLFCDEDDNYPGCDPEHGEQRRSLSHSVHDPQNSLLDCPTDHSYPPSNVSRTLLETPKQETRNLANEAIEQTIPAPLSVCNDGILVQSFTSAGTVQKEVFVTLVPVSPVLVSCAKLPATSEDTWTKTWEDSDYWPHRITTSKVEIAQEAQVAFTTRAGPSTAMTTTRLPP